MNFHLLILHIPFFYIQKKGTNYNYEKWILILTTSLLLTGCNTSTQTPDSVDSEKEPVNEHEYFCDKFLLTVDDHQIDLTTIEPELSSVSELYPIADDQLYILGRIDENYNSLMIYDFTKEEVVFSEHGTTMCWVQGKFETARYLKDNVVYDLDGNIIYQPENDKIISMIEYVVEDFMVTVTDSNYENPEDIWIE